jgi:hypothetical protein
MKKNYLYIIFTVLFTQTILSCRDKKESIDKVESSKYEEYCSYCGNGMIKGQSAAYQFTGIYTRGSILKKSILLAVNTTNTFIFGYLIFI